MTMKIMKKTYFVPSLEVVVLNVRTCLMAASGTLGVGDLPNATFDDPLPGLGLIAD